MEAEPQNAAPAAGKAGEAGEAYEAELPLLPGFREMALRRMSAQRRRLFGELAAARHSAGLSQTEVAARMGTSQSAVARLEAGDGDIRMSTLERYAAAVGSDIAWQLRAHSPLTGGRNVDDHDIR
jgi:DNA-binding transcriptional regulator YiaG